MKYEAYTPTKWEARIDKLISLASTGLALRRMRDRERMNYFRYLAAQPTSARPNSNSTTTGEWLRIQREKMQVMWNAIDMVDNSGLCTGILTKFPTYICGTLRWQARTGDKDINNAYQQYVEYKTGKPANIDLKGVNSLRSQCMLDIKSIMLKGDVGTNIVRDSDGELYLQGIEANRIGDPFRWDTSDTYVRGLVLDPNTGRVKSVRVYYQDRRSGMYKFDDEFPTVDEYNLPKFLFFTNPIDYDNYRGVSLFKHAIDNSTYIDTMRRYELQALLWASSQSGVYYTKSGTLPEALPFSRTPVVDKDGNTIDTFEARPNTLVALSADGEKVEMFQHDRPSPNVIGMYENTIIDISVGAGLTKQFTWGLTGTGPEVRMASAQDARTIQIWQMMLRESKLDNVILLILGDAIAKGILPYHENWLLWDWYFPAKPTIDVGRESDADISEIQAGINTGANVTAESGQGDIEDVITQRGHEVGMMIDAAMTEAQERGLDWKEVYAYMFPPKGGKGMGGGGFGAMAGMAGNMVAGQNSDKAGATDDGVEIDGGNGNGSGKRFSMKNARWNQDGSITVLYRPDQKRGEAGTPEGGQFVPEGGGGAAVATQKKSDVATVEPPKTAPVRITSKDVETHRGTVDSSALAKHVDKIDEAFKPDAYREVVPIDSLISTKDELHDPKFLAGLKGDPRQNATNRMVDAIERGGPKRDSITAEDNGDGTYTIKDGNATSQAAMLAGWKNLPIRVEMSDLDKKLIDYKPEERSLTDPSKIRRIDQVLPNTRIVPYTKAKFFDAVSKMQGTDPNKVSGEEYKLARDKLMDVQPIEEIPLDTKFVVTQRHVNTDKLASIAKWPKGYGAKGTKLDPIQVVRYNGEVYILNGHHRLVSFQQRGDTKIKAHVLDLGDQLPTDTEVNHYATAVVTKPKLDEIIDRNAAAHGAAALHAPLKRLGGVGGARDKVMSDYGGDWSQIKDIVRGSIVTEDETGMHEVAQDLGKELGIKPKYTPPGKVAYTDYKFNPVINGQKTEIKVVAKHIYEAAEKTHPEYKELQFINRNAKNRGRDLTTDELNRVAYLQSVMNNAYAVDNTGQRL